MANTVTTVLQNDDEEGVAAGAAHLGPDGGPVAELGGGEDAFDAFDDEDWLSEEFSEEELAALSEEDLGDVFSDDELGGEVFSNEDLEALDAEEEDFLEEDIDASFDDSDADFGASEEEFAADHAELAASPIDDDGLIDDPAAVGAVSQGALVASAASMIEQGYGEEVTDLGDEDVDHRPVPRISIHAFCEAAETTQLLEKASVDRRLSKAHLTIHMGGVAKAVDHFQAASTPNLIILETMAGGAEIFSQLGELAEVCDPSTKVVIIGHVNDIILYRELIRQGISEYIVRPQSPLQIIKAIADLYVDPAAPPIGKTVAFVGARGGAGSSTLAHNVGWCTAEEYESDTVILDLDLPFGTASLDFDQDASAGLVEALSSPERLDDVLLDRLLQKHTDRLSLFTAPSMLDRDFDLDDQAFETVLDVVRNVAPTVVVDVPHLWTSWSKRLLTTADEIIVVATPDLASFRNTKNLIDILSGARPNDAPPTLVLNQFDPKISAVQPDQFAEHVGLKPLHVFGWEPQLFAAAATNAAPITEVGAKSKIAVGIRELSAHVLGRADANIAKPKFSLADLFGKK